MNVSVKPTKNPIGLALLVTDAYLLFGLYHQDMTTFDASSQCISQDARARSWGEQLCASSLE